MTENQPTKQMQTIRFDQMKRRALDEFHCRLNIGSPFPSEGQFLALAASIQDAGGPRKPLVILQEWADYGARMIENWDIRCCMKLAVLFPSCLPKHLAARRPVCDYDEKGNWVLVFD